METSSAHMHQSTTYSTEGTILPLPQPAQISYREVMLAPLFPTKKLIATIRTKNTEVTNKHQPEKYTIYNVWPFMW